MRLPLLLAMVVCPVQLAAQQPSVAPIVREGLEAYRSRDAAAAVAVLYTFFHAYQVPDGTWKIMDMTWNTNWKEVVPPGVLGE